MLILFVNSGICACACRSVGAGLIDLYHSQPVQGFLMGNSTDTREKKAIFQPGALRKVCEYVAIHVPWKSSNLIIILVYSL